jgi:hypothetical protein
MGFIYKLVFRKAIYDTNKFWKITGGWFSSGNILKNLWSRMEVENPFSPFTKYFETDNTSN